MSEHTNIEFLENTVVNNVVAESKFGCYDNKTKSSSLSVTCPCQTKARSVFYENGVSRHPDFEHGNRASTLEQSRTIAIGIQNKKKYPDNRVISYKYTLWNFLPKNLFEQLRRIANFYFLCMSILASLIDGPVSPLASIGPLVFVVTVTAVKQGYEDYLRHYADSKVNSSIVTVVRNSCVQEIKCKHIQVGDIVRVQNNHDIPCDLVALISSQHDSKCYVTTANLDGETNLKCVDCAIPGLTVDHIPYLSGVINCEQSTMDLYQFHGNVTVIVTCFESTTYVNTTYVESEDHEISNINKQLKTEAEVPGSNILQDTFRKKHPWNFNRTSIAYNRDYAAPLTASNLLLRGSRLKNTEYIYGCAVYTGQDTKLALNSIIKTNKFSILERSVNMFLLFFFILLMLEVTVSVILEYFIDRNVDSATEVWYISGNESLAIYDLIIDFFSYVVLYYYIIPTSLYVTIELQRFVGTLFFEWDLQLHTKQQKAICNTSDLNEELGQVQYLFTDKTGTLTENEMCFHRCSINGKMYCEENGKLYILPESGLTTNAVLLDTWVPDIEIFFIAMALCHSVQCWAQNFGSKFYDDIPEYQASSTDEKALVEAAARCGVIFFGEEDGIITVSVQGRIVKYRKLLVLEFTSDRKRMSVVVMDEGGLLWLFCKGAEISLLPIVKSGSIAETIIHNTDFAMRGLRTLVFAYGELDPEQFVNLATQIKTARSVLDIEEKQALLDASYNELESNLILIGATAVEDKLQEKVPETLSMLQAAGIKVWILTGDKIETAVNIAYSCGHFKASTIRLYLADFNDSEICLKQLKEYRLQVGSDRFNNYGLIIDGHSLKKALLEDYEGLQELALMCTSVLCCRLSPKQKAQVVSLVKNSTGKPITLAVGDGANDVSMIQEAHVGLGIMGKEGRQAVRCSDYAFARFYCLSKALLVHGHWYYLRAAVLVQYFFYKNIVFITPQVFFTWNNGFSPQAIYLSVYLILYNTIFTAAPIVVYSLFEQDYKANTLLTFPELYLKYRNNFLMSRSHFAHWVICGIWHALMVYYVPAVMLFINPILLNNTPLELTAFGITILHNVVIVVNFKIWIYSQYWTYLFIFCEAASILGFITFSAVYNCINIVNTAESLYSVYWQLLISPSFWLISLIVTFLSLLPDFVAKILSNTEFRRNIRWQFCLPNRGSFKVEQSLYR